MPFDKQRAASDNDRKVHDEFRAYVAQGLSKKEAIRLVALAHGYSNSGVRGMISRARQPTADSIANPPEGYHVKGTSTLYDENGGVIIQWVKTDRDKEQWQQMIRAAIKVVEESVIPRKELLNPPVEADRSDWLTFYPVADWHIGMYASAMDTGEEWSLDIAVKNIRAGIDTLFDRSPLTNSAIVANIGDFTHVDNRVNRTPNSGAALDTDRRYIEVVQAGMELSIYVIDRALQKHNQVIVVWQPGNHDEATALVIQTALAQLYKNDPRITVHQSGRRTHVIQWGSNAIGMTHGDTIKPEALPLLMANDYPVIWAATTNRVWHTGHIHHRRVTEYTGCMVESHRSPAPKDAWHDQQGYRARRSICSIIYDFEGENSRNTVYFGGGK